MAVESARVSGAASDHWRHWPGRSAAHDAPHANAHAHFYADVTAPARTDAPGVLTAIGAERRPTFALGSAVIASVADSGASS